MFSDLETKFMWDITGFTPSYQIESEFGKKICDTKMLKKFMLGPLVNTIKHPIEYKRKSINTVRHWGYSGLRIKEM